MSPEDTDAVRARLEAQRQEIEDLSRASAESRAPVELDQQQQGRLSRMDAMQSQAINQAAERKRRTELTRIDAALARLDADEYGDCTGCGEEIGEARLTHDPAAALCVQCASAR